MIRTDFKLPNRKLSRMDCHEVVGPWRLHREGREVVGPWRCIERYTVEDELPKVMLLRRYPTEVKAMEDCRRFFDFSTGGVPHSNNVPVFVAPGNFGCPQPAPGSASIFPDISICD
ncbi:uncharacterized protein PpBr36_05817 [Pyricularia pennisetigena]|uniref:uncharacterized protein n=1 Tax=Pyricularia pennisetigena TaxID=1578925 RepID=UPI001154A675|nr:uncharacterized protein PpBr36_05817 [Pyricularia pennisetigena]TLS23490.1 hypothetical protein PpBr36_05817 [Pyricularia pennisetigena]